ALGDSAHGAVTTASVYQGALQQATLLSYIDDFKMMGLVFLGLLPFLLLVRPGKGGGEAGMGH
ncbi:hypothetical protein LWS67_21865, partial [Bacillus atrophaeus]|uniref:hypothetical protein n=1 Tax=Bacillus atrophaeus TaxID=1452 RepID=UPI001EFC174E